MAARFIYSSVVCACADGLRGEAMTRLYTRPVGWTVSDFMLAGVPRKEIDRRKALARYLPMAERITRYYTTAAEDAQYDRDGLELYEFSRENQEWRRDMADMTR